MHCPTKSCFVVAIHIMRDIIKIVRGTVQHSFNCTNSI